LAAFRIKKVHSGGLRIIAIITHTRIAKMIFIRRDSTAFGGHIADGSSQWPTGALTKGWYQHLHSIVNYGCLTGFMLSLR